MGKVILEVKNICKTFLKDTPNEKISLDHMSLTLEEGDFVTIIGSNGAGKSTLFNAISGTIDIDEGSILLDGKDITFMKDYKRAYEISRIFQDPMKGTAPNMTIAENLALAYTRKAGKSIFPLNRKDMAYFYEILNMLDMGLENRLNTKMGVLSGGQRQAVSLLMTVISEPKLLLLDEHTAALDPAISKKILELTNYFVDKYHITTLMITHSVKDALENGNRMIALANGRIKQEFSAEEKKLLDPLQLAGMYE
ncbi:ABC transporter ATP-binding protein [Parasporobacterium paucivorans]|uniref:Putative ABC transport system ATP-binding protein n=1 Tax=Parasporobacterium paucivorans DSM 15970 TaxID=1122934 RepID=A0A1M6JBS3_9FIRM|nr:ATP-binding cassette domain-containing protein [Parasporobacterium paucivorans]SHJ44110.1 putative ABC transport system ATP-binding protein [Parasporobacterium paucivorans DSM 15970]